MPIYAPDPALAPSFDPEARAAAGGMPHRLRSCSRSAAGGGNNGRSLPPVARPSSPASVLTRFCSSTLHLYCRQVTGYRYKVLEDPAGIIAR